MIASVLGVIRPSAVKADGSIRCYSQHTLAVGANFLKPIQVYASNVPVLECEALRLRLILGCTPLLFLSITQLLLMFFNVLSLFVPQCSDCLL